MTPRRALGSLVALGLLLPACSTALSPDHSPRPIAVACAPNGPAAAPSVGETTRIASEGMIDVEVTVGAASSVSISCAPELLPHIHVESRGDLLRIWTDPHLETEDTGRCVALVGSPRLLSFEATGSGDGRIHGHAEEVERVVTTGSGDVEIDELAAPSPRLEASGSGNVTAHGLHAQTLAITTTGSGDVRVAGTSERVQITSDGSGDVDAHDLRAAAVDARTSGSGDIAIAASQRAEVNTSGSGDVVVRGRPAQRIANSDGSGSISFE